MRIAHIVGSLEARYGGPSRSVRHLATATAELGHEVDLLTSAPQALALENRGRLRIRTWRRAWPGALCRVPDMAEYLNRERFDVVHHHGLWLRTLHYAQRAAARHRTPLVIAPRGMMSAWAWRQHRARKIFASRCLHPGAFAAVNGWHATSPEEAAEIRSLGFAQPVCIAPNGVEAPAAAEMASAGAHWQALIPASANRRVALFYSRFHHKKRIIELIDLWAAVAPENWLLLLVGIPEQYSVSQLRSYIVRAGAVGKIEAWDGTHQPPPYALASLFLLPSHNENFGLVVAEACAHGVPVLVTDTTPWSGIQREEAGWCVPWEHYEATLRAALREEPEPLRARGGRAREWILREFSWRSAAEKLGAFYLHLKGAEN